RQPEGQGFEHPPGVARQGWTAGHQEGSWPDLRSVDACVGGTRGGGHSSRASGLTMQLELFALTEDERRSAVEAQPRQRKPRMPACRWVQLDLLAHAWLSRY